MREPTAKYLADDLYIIFEDCTNDELSPIVNILSSLPKSKLKFTRAYERHYPDHSKYAEQIGDEIYRLGFELTDSKYEARPAYIDLLRTVWQKIGISKMPDDVPSLESNLLNVFSTQNILSVGPAQSQELVEQACAAAGTAVGGLLSSDSWPPFASTLMQASHLRDKLQREGRIPALEDNRVMSPARIGNVDQPRSEVALTSDNGDPLAIFKPIPELIGGTWNSYGKIDNILKYLSVLATVIEPLMSAEEILSSGNYYRTDFKLSLNKNGDPVGSAKGYQGLVPFQKVALASIGGPTAFLVAIQQMQEQKRWENIERSLTDVKIAVESVAKFQKDGRRTALTGSIRYFQQIAPSVLSGELADEILHGIERYESELLKIQDHITEDIKTQTATLRSIKNEAWLSSSKFMKALDEAIVPLEALYNEMRLCLRARACGFQLLCSYPGREAGKNSRREDILTSIAHLGPNGAGGQELDQILREKANLTSSFDNKMRILKHDNEILSITNQYELQIRKSMDLFVPPSPENDMNIPIEFEVKDGVAVGFRTV